MLQFGSTALIMAAGRGPKDTVELLLDRGADPEAKTGVSRERLLPWGADCTWRHGRTVDRVGDGGMP